MPGMVADVVTRGVELGPMLDDAQVTVTMTRLHQIWDQLFPAEQIRIVHGYWAVSPHDTEVRLRQIGIERLGWNRAARPRSWHDPTPIDVTRGMGVIWVSHGQMTMSVPI